MRKYTFPLVVLFLLYSPFSASAFNLDAATLPDNWGGNNLYTYAYNFATNNYHPLDDMGIQYWRDNANIPPPGNAGYRPLIQIGHPTLWGGAYSTYIRLEPSADPQCAWVHPPEDAVLAWDVQANGTYRLQGEFLLPGDYGSGSDGINYYIKKNNTVLYGGYLGIWGTTSFDLTVGLVDTDWIYFGVNANRDDFYDWGHLKGSINPVNPVPEPTTMLLIGSGLVGLAGVRKRFKK